MVSPGKSQWFQGNVTGPLENIFTNGFGAEIVLEKWVWRSGGLVRECPESRKKPSGSQLPDRLANFPDTTRESNRGGRSCESSSHAGCAAPIGNKNDHRLLTCFAIARAFIHASS